MSSGPKDLVSFAPCFFYKHQQSLFSWHAGHQPHELRRRATLSVGEAARGSEGVSYSSTNPLGSHIFSCEFGSDPYGCKMFLCDPFIHIQRRQQIGFALFQVCWKWSLGCENTRLLLSYALDDDPRGCRIRKPYHSLSCTHIGHVINTHHQVPANVFLWSFLLSFYRCIGLLCAHSFFARP